MQGMRISELSTRAGVPVSTLRYYEAEGLLPAGRADNGYRIYDQAAVDRLAFIGQAKTLALPLAEIRELVLARDAEPCRSVRSRYRPMLDQRTAEVDGRIAELQALRSTLIAGQQRLAGLPDRDQPCNAECSFLHDEAADPLAGLARSPGTSGLGPDRWRRGRAGHLRVCRHLAT